MSNRKQILIALVLMISICTGATAQTSPNFTRADASRAANDDELVAGLVAEVKAGRAAVAALQSENETLRAQLKVEQANSASLAKSYADAERQIAANERAIAPLENAIALHEKTVAVLSDAYEKEKASNKKNKKRAAWATVIAIASVVLRVL